jgi:hypothetical protein
VKDDQGNIVHWAAEMRAPGNLEANGYTRKGLMEKLAPGANVVVTGNPSKACKASAQESKDLKLAP